MRPTIGFVLEQALGHVAYGMSLRRAIERRDDLDAVWLEVSSSSGARGLGCLPSLAGRFLQPNLRARFAIARTLRRRRLDALFVHTEAIGVLSADYIARIPTLLSLDATPKNFDELGAWYGRPTDHPSFEDMKSAIHRGVIGRARAVTTWSEWAKRSVVDDYGIAPGSVTVIHPGTALDAFPRSKAHGAAGLLKILFVGADFERKGGDLLVRVFREHFAGQAELHLVTSASVEPEPGVFVHRGVRPHSKELFRLYAEADMFVLPTRADCFGVVFGEAMAAGLPVVTTRVAAIPEFIVESESGFVIGVDDGRALQERIARLLGDAGLRRRMGAKARSLAEERFDIDKNADRLVGLLFGMLQGARGHAKSQHGTS